jgi:hypothetical protein
VQVRRAIRPWVQLDASTPWLAEADGLSPYSAWIHRSAIAVAVVLTRPGPGVRALALRDGGAAGGGG